jgi:hypothetical protein
MVLLILREATAVRKVVGSDDRGAVGRRGGVQRTANTRARQVGSERPVVRDEQTTTTTYIVRGRR